MRRRSENTRSDFLLLLREFLVDGCEPFVGMADGFLHHLADVQACDLHRERFRLQAIAFADVAGAGVLKAFEFFAHPGGVRFLETAVHIGDHAFERLLGFVSAKSVVIDEFDFVFARPVKDDFARLLRKVLPRIVEREFIMRR